MVKMCDVRFRKEEVRFIRVVWWVILVFIVYGWEVGEFLVIWVCGFCLVDICVLGKFECWYLG